MLLNRNLIGNVSVAGIQLDHLDFLAYFLPPAIAFCVLNIFVAADEQMNYENLMACLAKAKLPGFYASKIYLLFTSGLGLLSSDIPGTFVTRLGRLNSNVYAAAQFILILAGFLGFEIYSYTYLFSHFKGSAGTILSLLATVSFITMTALRIIDWVSDPAPTASYV